MTFGRTSEDSLEALRRLRDEARRRGDETLAVILTGVELYASLGREFELLEMMKKFADEMKEVIEQTPTVEELRRLYETEGPPVETNQLDGGAA
ncbi:MAG: hypothetical protein RMK57_03810 [Bryobacterales bacterium]|nr:hypothetical protein [Bryobacteraceae bacterium]MDW8353635.1 hypothetical protein [Bryobacterales bacterium]